MSIKVQLILLLAIVLHVSTRVTSLEEEVVTEKAPAYAPAKPTVHSPYKAPVHPPKMAPVHPPKKAPVHPPVKAPVYPPKKAPVYPPAKSTNPHGNCIKMCAIYCSKDHKSKRHCQRICVPCCDKYKCVPGCSKGCSQWGEVMYHGQMINCPKY